MRDAMKVLKAAADRNRMRILKMLEQKDMCVCEMAAYRLLHLVSVIREATSAIPMYWPNQAFFACAYEKGGRRYDSELIYQQRK